MYEEWDVIKQTRKKLIRNVEEAFSEADWRVLGGFKTEDQKFALNMRELMRDLLKFLDDYEASIDEEISDLKGTIDMRDEEVAALMSTIQKIDNWVDDRIRLEGVKQIIKDGCELY